MPCVSSYYRSKPEIERPSLEAVPPKPYCSAATLAAITTFVTLLLGAATAYCYLQDYGSHIVKYSLAGGTALSFLITIALLYCCKEKKVPPPNQFGTPTSATSSIGEIPATPPPRKKTAVSLSARMFREFKANPQTFDPKKIETLSEEDQFRFAALLIKSAHLSPDNVERVLSYMAVEHFTIISMNCRAEDNYTLLHYAIVHKAPFKVVKAVMLDNLVKWKGGTHLDESPLDLAKNHPDATEITQALRAFIPEKAPPKILTTQANANVEEKKKVVVAPPPPKVDPEKIVFMERSALRVLVDKVWSAPRKPGIGIPQMTYQCHTRMIVTAKDLKKVIVPDGLNLEELAFSLRKYNLYGTLILLCGSHAGFTIDELATKLVRRKKVVADFKQMANDKITSMQKDKSTDHTKAIAKIRAALQELDAHLAARAEKEKMLATNNAAPTSAAANANPVHATHSSIV